MFTFLAFSQTFNSVTHRFFFSPFLLKGGREKKKKDFPIFFQLHNIIYSDVCTRYPRLGVYAWDNFKPYYPPPTPSRLKLFGVDFLITISVPFSSGSFLPFFGGRNNAQSIVYMYVCIHPKYMNYVCTLYASYIFKVNKNSSVIQKCIGLEIVLFAVRVWKGPHV